MISEITGLPAIIIESLNPVSNNLENNKLSKEPDNNKNLTKSAEYSVSSNAQNVNKENSNKNRVSFEEFQKKLQDALKENNLSLEFSKDQELNKMIIKIVNSETKEIIRQIPPDVALKIARIVSAELGTGQIADVKI
jgi:flagellar protein FlaG